jgi:hypothetical protein
MSLTSVIRYVRALDSTATDGSGKTGLVFGDFTAKYLTQGGTLTSLTTETITTLGTYQAPTSAAHIRIKELSSSDPCNGIYEVHFHNTQMTDTGKKLWLFLSASGAAIQPLEVELLPYYSDVRELLGTAWLTPGTAGTPDVNTKLAGGTAWGSGAINAAAIADGAIDRATFAADTGLQSVRSNTAQNNSGSTTSIKFDAGASSVDDFYKKMLVYITGGSGVGQSSVILNYTGSTKIAALNETWPTAADNTSTFVILATDKVNVETFLGSACQIQNGYPLVYAYDVAANALARFFTLDTTKVYSDAVNGSVVKEIVTNASGGGGLTQADVRTAVGLTSANLDTQLASIQADTDNLQTRIPAALTSGGRMKSSVEAVLDTAFTEGASGRIAAGFKQFFNIASPAATMDHLVLVDAVTNLTNLPTIPTDWLTAGGLAASAVAEIQSGLSTLDASGVRTAVGLASANLDTQIAALPASNATALLDLSNGVETSVTPRQLLRAVGAALSGLLTGSATGTEVFKGIGQSSSGTTRATYTIDSSGNRPLIVLNL